MVIGSLSYRAAPSAAAACVRSDWLAAEWIWWPPGAGCDSSGNERRRCGGLLPTDASAPARGGKRSEGEGGQGDVLRGGSERATVVAACARVVACVAVGGRWYKSSQTLRRWRGSAACAGSLPRVGRAGWKVSTWEDCGKGRKRLRTKPQEGTRAERCQRHRCDLALRPRWATSRALPLQTRRRARELPHRAQSLSIATEILRPQECAPFSSRYICPAPLRTQRNCKTCSKSMDK